MSKRKRSHLTINEQEKLLEDFYTQLDDDGFLGHTFEDENDDFELDSRESDSSESEPDDPVMDLDDNDNSATDVAVDNTPRKQKFSNMDEVLNLDNYTPLPQQEHARYRYSDKKGSFVVDWETTKTDNPRHSGRLPARSIITKKPGPTRHTSGVSNPLEAFSYFIPDDLLQSVVLNTNNTIRLFRDKFHKVIESSDKYTHCNFIDLIELKAFIGLLYLRGALKQNLFNANFIWYHESANDIFSATMTLKRFQFICRFLQFDDKTTREERWKHDRYACIRCFFEEVNKNNAKGRNPSPYLAIDETLYPYRGHISFKQYNPSKPAKYGLLYRSLCDSVVPYTYFTLPYAGKPNEIDDEAAQYYVTGTDEYTKYLVRGFCKYNQITGCNISMDRFFTSIPIAEWASQNNFTIVGTIRLDRKGIPNEIKSLDSREEKSTKYVYQSNGDILLVSYVDKKKSGKKNIVVLSTMHSGVSVTNDQRKKPNVHLFYDHTKGGVDIVDLISSHDTTKIKSKRWPINAFAYILDTVRTNSKVILQEASAAINLSTLEFTYNLGKMLVMPNVQRRYTNNNGRQMAVTQKMRRVLGIVEVNRSPSSSISNSNAGRCHICLESILGTPNYKSQRDKLNNKLKTKCEKCKEITCKVHCAFICQSCAEN